MTTEFKVGDRVRYIPCKNDADGAWQNVTITRIDDGGYWGDDDNPDFGNGYFPKADHRLELVKRPIPDDIAARALLVAELRALGKTDDARRLAKGELYEVEPWIAMRVIAGLV